MIHNILNHTTIRSKWYIDRQNHVTVCAESSWYIDRHNQITVCLRCRWYVHHTRIVIFEDEIMVKIQLKLTFRVLIPKSLPVDHVTDTKSITALSKQHEIQRFESTHATWIIKGKVILV